MFMTNWTYDFLEKLAEAETENSLYYLNDEDIMLLDIAAFESYCEEYEIDINDERAYNDAIPKFLSVDTESFVGYIDDLNLRIDGLTEKYISFDELLQNAQIIDYKFERLPDTYKLTQFEYKFLLNLLLAKQNIPEYLRSDLYLVKDRDGTTKIFSGTPEWSDDGKSYDNEDGHIIYEFKSYANNIYFNDIKCFDCVPIQDMIDNCYIVEE